MRRRHLKNVIAIERRIFPSPWSIGLYMSEIAQPDTRAYYVAYVGTELVGYAGMMVVVGEAHVTNIGVAPEWQRHGIGRRLLLQLAREARERSAQHLTLEVRVSNLGAQALYHEFGFVPAGYARTTTPRCTRTPLSCGRTTSIHDLYRTRLDGIESRLRPLGPSRWGAAPAKDQPEP